jgi:hypothetical protein
MKPHTQQSKQPKQTKKRTYGEKKTGTGKKKKRYRIRNWREYNEALVNRGKILFWIAEDALRRWNEQNRTGKRGKPKLFSDTAIETALTLRAVFHLPLRQTEGFLASVLEQIGALVTAPDYSTLSIRSRFLSIAVRVRHLSNEPLHLVVDSTGMKVYGEGEWKVRQHGWGKRRTWRKLHIGVDERTGDIMLGEVTGNDTADCEMLKPLLAQLPKDTSLDQVSADGAFDKRICYDALAKQSVLRIAIPPQKNARIWRHGNRNDHPLPRDENLRRIRQIGRKAWKRESGYHRRSIVETAMFRLKTIFTDRVRSTSFVNQCAELMIRLKALNRMSTLGMPLSYIVA